MKKRKKTSIRSESIRNKPRNPEYLAPIGIFVLALLIRLLYLLDISDTPTFSTPIIDSHTYLTMARAFVQDKTFTHEFFWQPFFYPFFLSMSALFTSSFLIIQIVIGSLTCVLTYLLGREIFDKRTGIIAGSITSLYGTLIFFNSEYVAATWAAFWAVGLILIFIKTEKERKKPFFFVLGLSGGLSILTRPSFLPFFFLGCVWLIVRLLYKASKTKDNTPRLLLLFSGFLLTILPVCFLNRHVTGKFSFLPYSGGINFYIGNNEDYCKTVTIRPGYEWDKLTALPLRSGMYGPYEEQAFFYKKAREFIKTKPGAFSGLLGRKTLRFFSSRELPRNIDIYLYRRWSLLLGLLVWKKGGFGFPLGLIFPLALVGLFNERRKIPVPFFLFIILFPLSVILVFPSARYRVPLIPAIAILGAAGCVSLWFLNVQKNWRSLGYSFLIFLAALFISVLPGPFCEEPVNYEAEMVYALGHQANEKGDREEAIRLYTRALELAPDLDDARNNLGVALVDLGTPEDSVTLFKEVLDKNPDREDAHNNLAMALVRLQQFDEAIFHYRKAIEINPHFTEAYFNLANCYGMIEENEEAIRNYKTALQTKPDYVKASFNLANLYAAIGELENAAKEYQAVLAKEPGNIDAKNNLANVFLMQERFEEAEKQFREVLGIRPDFAPSLFGLGNLCFEKKDYTFALSYYKDAIRINPRFAQVYYKMANICQMRGELKEAVNHYEKAMNLLPEWDKPDYNLAWIFASCEDVKVCNPQKAIGIAENLCEKTSYSNPEYLDLLSAAYARAGRFREAVETAQKAVRLATENHAQTLPDEIQKRLRLYRENKAFKNPCTTIPPYPVE